MLCGWPRRMQESTVIQAMRDELLATEPELYDFITNGDPAVKA